MLGKQQYLITSLYCIFITYMFLITPPSGAIIVMYYLLIIGGYYAIIIGQMFITENKQIYFISREIFYYVTLIWLFNIQETYVRSIDQYIFYNEMNSSIICFISIGIASFIWFRLITRSF
jgi:hypothetical protein